MFAFSINISHWSYFSVQIFFTLNNSFVYNPYTDQDTALSVPLTLCTRSSGLTVLQHLFMQEALITAA